MKIIVTGSLGNIGKPLTQKLVQNGHSVTVISSKAERQKEIEALGAKAAIGSVLDYAFLLRTFTGADIVYLMEPPAANSYGAVSEIVATYKKAVEQSGVKKIVHLSSIGAHTDKGVGILSFHNLAENILKKLPNYVDIKFMRPTGFYSNLLSNIDVIKSTSKGFLGGLLSLQYYGIRGLLTGKRGVILANYGGEVINLMVSADDIATVIFEEMEKPFEGRTVRYIASEELTCNEIAKILGEAIGKPYLKHGKISDKMLANAMLKTGMNEQMVNGIVEMGVAGRTGKLYEDYYKNRPTLGKTKLKQYATEFATKYNQK
ncbi:uncharacterized protein YbjT (DUF2867 family) [Paenibacillus cellulosilyticus]|uniref:Uncharacterized protein YbjT (DUF2867 family) n=1 Tax=Paenibacillus cellulosilyticus TaxID=375489 RepID=A0A2V2Z1R0_9BACL|nr:NAD(P)H-binding protein [Paenibacillus cellulosilyticus]PWW08782.1 uncharacterized protein YbjT (DUF2867 family) [Paenibacillus cellulosilyticus]QKS48337.1 NAD(P)H-binding protein [Paenibacillus cellulosilyticus]